MADHRPIQRCILEYLHAALTSDRTEDVRVLLYHDGSDVDVHGYRGTQHLTEGAYQYNCTVRVCRQSTLACLATYECDFSKSSLGMSVTVASHTRECLHVSYSRLDVDLPAALALINTALRCDAAPADAGKRARPS